MTYGHPCHHDYPLKTCTLLFMKSSEDENDDVWQEECKDWRKDGDAYLQDEFKPVPTADLFDPS